MGSSIRLTSLELEIMQVLYDHGKVYGLKIMNALNEGRRQSDLPEIPYGSFYPALKKLGKSKLLDSEWGSDKDKTSNGARRRYYRINADGVSTLLANQEYSNWIKDKLTLQPEGGGEVL